MITYRLYQNNNTESSQYKKWYARAVTTETATLNSLAERIQRNCTVKKSDVLAVLTELVEVMRDELQSSHKVKLDGFGSFKIALRSTGADSVKEFAVKSNIKGMRVLFQPELKISADGRRIRTFLDGCKVAELPKNDVKSGADTGTTTPDPQP
ncbi:HU family DNA-binding protein [Xylanibacter rodentium]|uniref:DNA-binding protein n=1 Tax=Xylanibacter rodentium TaxID=2736289 RepID=A0ABX2B143_9BACT|nr:HU family DNA-binding protein [Xylanibacter rodentium]NPE10070.1 DNA-binding protein [Prevotella sp. PJ1A]NPE15377.1 DNA-binding protein [Xylanibacter rodentium]NPE38346.1 DNA-binding protein [Prevotella sp. PCJ2]